MTGMASGRYNGIGDIERNYDWYLNQHGTGDDEWINCGPACALMAALWFNEGFEATVQETRDSIPGLEGKWWFYRDIRSFLSQNGIDITYSFAFSLDDAKKALKEGRIIIVNIHTRDIAYRNDITTIGRFYTGEFGHFIILKGYRVLDGSEYFEVYDPYTINDFFADGSPMGKNRLYPADEVIKSVRDWGDAEYIVINQRSEKQ